MEALHHASVVIGFAGAFVLALGVLLTLTRFLRLEAAFARGRDVRMERRALRTFLGYYLLLGLEILIAADVLDTLTKPAIEELVGLGAIVLIRSIIGHALHSELSHGAGPGSVSAC